ncbi:MAG TPA: FGGY-family carbohydrate kinase, partial [Bellilinea sp.]|nr:FGGY-family carbohydrate kinase [Bellilinea sp.]
MTKDQLLAIDFGTQSVRALIFSLDGTLVAKSQIPVTGYRSEKPGWVEMDAERYWDYLGEACQNLWQQPSPDRQKIAGVALTSQRNNVVNVDKQGKPLRPVIHWSDQRRTFGVKPVGGLWGAAFKLVNMDETVRTFQAEAESNWIQRFQPEIWAATHKFMYLTGYLTYRMTGKMVDSVGCQVGFVPFDYKRHHWANRLDWKWQAVNIEPEKLPGLVKPTETLGVITHEASEATGIPEGLPLIAAAGDKACEALGAGCIEPDDGCLSFGTTSNIITMHDRYIEPIPMIPPYPAAIPGHYSLEIQIFRGYWMVNWFKREFGMNEERIAKERGVPTESLFDELVKSVPPGSLGLMLQPYWTPGVKMPGPEAKGSIIG